MPEQRRNQGLIRAMMAQARPNDGRGFWGNVGAALREGGRATPVGQLLSGGGIRGAWQATPAYQMFDMVRDMFGGRDPYSGAQASGAVQGPGQMGPPSSLSMYGPATGSGNEIDPNFVGPPSAEGYAGNPSSPGFVGPPAAAQQRYMGAAQGAGMTGSGSTLRGAAVDPVGSMLSRAMIPWRQSGGMNFGPRTQQQ